MSRRRIALATTALALAATPALAAPDQTFELTAAAPTTKWEGPAQTTHGAPLYQEDARTAIPCDTPSRPCDDVLLKVGETGKLTVKVEGTEDLDGTTDVDLYIYKSDAEGAEGDKLATAAASGPDTATVKVTPGYYLARADYYHAENGGYAGEAKLSGFATAPAPVAPVTAPAPAPTTAEGTPKPAQRTTGKRAKCMKKAKKIKNKRKRAKAVKRSKKQPK
jgi:uncharacterized protein (DUF2141 family)